MRSLAIIFAAAALLISSAALAALPGSLQYKWKITRPDGTSFVVTYHDDGTYTTTNEIKGTWKLDGNKVCVTRSTGESNCIDAKLDAKPGDTWQSQDATGKSVTVLLEAN